MDMYKEELERIQEVLRRANAKIKEYEAGDEVYRYTLVNFETMRKLKRMEEEFGKRLQEKTGVLPKRPYFPIAKLVCGEKAPLDYYHFTLQKKYAFVKDKNKILEDLEKHFQIWKNKVLLETSKYIRQNNLSESEAKELQDKTLRRIGEAYIKFSDIKEHPQKYEIIYTNYPHAKLYPEIVHRFADEERFRTTLLRKDVLNILCYEERKREKRRRKDMEIESFLGEAENPFGYIFVKKAKK